MEDLFSMMLKDIAKIGTYIVCITPNATKHIEEQYYKAGMPTEESKQAAALLLEDLSVTLGEPYLIKGKLVQLLAGHLVKEQREGLKNYIFAIRNMLSHSIYREYIKAIDRPSLKLIEVELFLEYIEARYEEELDVTAKETYSLLYAFVQGCTFINRIWAVAPNSEEYTVSSLLLPQLVNPAMELVRKRTELPPRAVEKVQVDASTTLQDEELVSCLRAVQIYLPDLNVEDLLKGECFENSWHGGIVLLAKMLRNISDEMIELSMAKAQPMKESVQKVKKVQAVKPSKSEKQWQKELYNLQQERVALRDENEQLREMVKQLEQKQVEVAKELLVLKDENARLEADLELLMEEPTVSKKAQQMMEQLGQLVGELQQELLKEPEQVEVVDSTYVELIRGVRLAVVGGHQKYHAQLKAMLKNEQLLCIGPDALNFDPRKLSSYDVIVFSSGYSNHSLYEKAFDYLKRNGEKEKCLMLHTQPNANGLAARVYQFLNGEG